MTGQDLISGLRRVRPAILLVIAILTNVVAVLPGPARADAEVFASVGTGELNGVYYPVGKAICQIVNRDLSTHGVRCSPEATPGSVYNISAVQSGEVEFAIVQSDVHLPPTKAKVPGSADRLTVCDPCCPYIPSSSPSWPARICIFRILRAWRADG